MLLRPIVGILLRSGVSFARFADIARSVYVEVAGSEFGIRGRPTNSSRVAMLTGLSRTQVKRERDLLATPEADDDAPEDKVRHTSRILLGWHSDPKFLDENDEPRLLRMDGETPSLADLYERYSGKVVPITALVKELLTVRAIEEAGDGYYRVSTRSYTPQATDPAALTRVSLAIADLASTGCFNLYRKSTARPRFERFATNQLIPASAESEFRDFLEIEGQAFLERADDWLTQREKCEGDDDLVRIGVGVYQIASSPSDQHQKPEKRKK